MDNGSNVVFGNDVTFAYTLPAVTTDAATNITSASATLNGNLTSLGSASYVDVYFVAGLDTYSHVTPGLQETAAAPFDDLVISKRKNGALKNSC